MTKKICKLFILIIGTITIAVSIYLASNAPVFAACTASQTCPSSPAVFCAGDNNCRANNIGGGKVSCDNGRTRTICYCGRGCRDVQIGGGGGVEEPEEPPVN